MANLGSYTTTEAVRGCLGIDANDMPDAYMVDSKLDVELRLDLNSWLAAHATLFSAGKVDGAAQAAADTADCISLYAQWFCAHAMANRPHAIPQITTDGKAQIDRFKIDWVKVAALAAGKAAQYKAELDTLVNGAAPVTAAPRLISVAIPSQDPITEGLQ